MEKQITIQQSAPIINVRKLTKGYGWGITIQGEDTDKVLKQIEDIDNKLTEKYKEDNKEYPNSY